MKSTTLRMRLAATMLAVGTIAFAHAVDLQPYPKKGQVLQRLNAFDNPEGSIFSADGKYVFISNAAEIGMPDKGFHFTHKGGRWREADPEDTLRFHALRLHELGMIKNTPQKIIAQGTDWRFLKELKRELKA